jgi:hypothetical protein
MIQASVQATSFPIPFEPGFIPAAFAAPSERKRGSITNLHITVPLPAHRAERNEEPRTLDIYFTKICWI